MFDYKRRNGQYIGSFAPYGYIKDPKDKHQLSVDPEAAEIVKLIYTKTLQGETRRAIVYHLNDHGIPSPTTYRKNKGLPYSCLLYTSVNFLYVHFIFETVPRFGAGDFQEANNE